LIFDNRTQLNLSLIQKGPEACEAGHHPRVE
jgi:hypothetical protein